jgi:hypothetical protein
MLDTHYKILLSQFKKNHNNINLLLDTYDKLLRISILKQCASDAVYLITRQTSSA